MPEGHGALLAALAAGPGRVREALCLLPEERLPLRPRPGKWSAREIALHLCDTEVSVAFRCKRALAEPGSAVPAFAQDQWVDTLGPWQDLEAALAAFSALRAELVAILRRLPDEAWTRVSVHPEAGPVSVAEWVRRFVAHTDQHIAQIRALAEPPAAAQGAGE